MDESAVLKLAESINNLAVAVTNLNLPKKRRKKEVDQWDKKLDFVPDTQPVTLIEPKPLTPLQRLVKAWKKVIDVPESEWKSWDTANYGRTARDAKTLMEVFKVSETPTTEELEPIVDCMIEVVDQMKKANLNYNLGTVVKNAHEWRQKNGYN